MNPELQNKVWDAIQQLAGKLGSTAEYLWPKAIRFVAVDAAVSVAMGFVVLGACLWGGHKAFQIAREEGDEVYRPLGVISIAVGLLVFVRTVGSSLPAVFEPVGYLVSQAIRSK